MDSNLIKMLDLHDDANLEQLLARFASIGGVLDYVPFRSPETPSEEQHRQAALEAMILIDRALESWALEKVSDELPIQYFFRVTMDENKLHGKPISFVDFWGNDDVAPKQLSPTSWSLPNVDGYKTAFFHPPYGIRGLQAENEDLFRLLNDRLFGESPESCAIFSWSTDWSNYFEAGHEWWGAFFWTIYSPQTQWLTAIGASSTD